VEELTGKERFLRLFRGEPIDRIPVSPRVFQNVVYEFLGTRDVDVVEGTIEFCRHFGIDIMDWNCTPPFEDFNIEGPNWKPSVKTEVSGNTTYEIVTVETPGGELRRVHSTTQTGKWEVETAITEFPIKTERDFELMVEYQPPVPRFDTSSITRAIELIGDDGIVTPAVHGPVNILVYYYRKLDDVLVDMMVSPDFYHRMIEHFMSRHMEYAQQLIDAGGPLIDIGANVANSKLVSADFWVKNMLPYENRFVDFIQDQGVVGLFHNCGYAAGHLDVYPQLHHRVWAYMTPPPYGDVILEEAVEKLPQSMILGPANVDQIDFLRQASPEEVEERVRQVIETVKPRGNFILGTSDYLEVNTPYENIRAFVDAGHKYGRYVN
jgi:uroporphyrinogen-III decarboxylase